MDPIDNPFSMSAGNPPAALAGREAQTEQFRQLLGRLSKGRHEQSIILSGLRGVGKTALLLEFERIATTEGWTTAEPFEARPDTKLRAELARAAREAVVRLDRRRAIGERLQPLLGLIERFKAGVRIAGSIDISIDTSSSPGTSGELEPDLVDLFIELGEVAKAHQSGVVFLIDEMQFLQSEELEALVATMHRMSRRQLPVALVGAGLPPLPGLVVNAKSYAEQLFSFPRLGSLTPEASRAALEQPAKALGVTFDVDALEVIVEAAGGYPTFIQAFGKEAWNAANPASQRITREDALCSREIAQSKLDEEFFHVRFERATERERAYMAAMADLGDGPYRTKDVAGRLGRALSATSAMRDTLLKKGLIYSPDLGEVDFTVRRFAEFMRRRYPLDLHNDGGRKP